MLIAIGFYIIQASDAHEIFINKTLHSAAATRFSTNDVKNGIQKQPFADVLQNQCY